MGTAGDGKEHCWHKNTIGPASHPYASAWYEGRGGDVSRLSGRLFERARERKQLVRSRLWSSCPELLETSGLVEDSLRFDLVFIAQLGDADGSVPPYVCLLAATETCNHAFRLYFAAHSHAQTARWTPGC